MVIQEKNRFFINVLKGLAIFLMLWGHCIQYLAQDSFSFFANVAFKFIYSFHMPLFMLISGYLFYYSFEKRDMKELIIHRSKPLLWTIFVCGAFNYVITVGVVKIYTSRTISQFFEGALFSFHGDLWFLWAVLSASLGVAVICKKVNKVWLQLILLALWSIVVYAFPSGDSNLYVYPAFLTGFFYSKYQDKFSDKVKKTCMAISVVAFAIMYYFYVKGITFDNAVIDFIFPKAYKIIIGIVGSLAVISVVWFLFNLMTLKTENRLPLSYSLSKMGEKSLQIYVLSVAFLSYYLPRVYAFMISHIFGYNVLAHDMFLYTFVYSFIIAVIYSFALYYLIKFFDKIKFSKILFGK